MPENALLSHDLLEGLYARTAVLTDVEIFDQLPSDHVALLKRSHRWTRGDWQLLPWLLPRVRDARGRYEPNPLSIIGRWKLIDNLRRSLLAPATFLWLVAAWAVFPGPPAAWTALVLSMSALPSNAWGAFKVGTVQAFFSIAELPHKAYLMSDAIVRTLYRLLVSRKRLLEWVTASQTQQESVLRPARYMRFMWPGPAAALAGFGLLIVPGSRSLAFVVPLLLAWLASPLLEYRRSRRIQNRFDALEARATEEMRQAARHTWRLYEEDAEPLRPTHFGRQLLWTIGAYELGVFGVLESARRPEALLAATGPRRLKPAPRGDDDARPHRRDGKPRRLPARPAAEVPRTRRTAALRRAHRGRVDRLSEVAEERVCRRQSQHTRRGVRRNARSSARGDRDVSGLPARREPAADARRVETFLRHHAAACSSVNTAHMAPHIRAHCPAALSLWERLSAELDRPVALAQWPERLAESRVMLDELRARLEQSLPPDVSVFRVCEELRDAVEESLQAMSETCARYARLADGCRAVAGSADFRTLFDAEYNELRRRLQTSLAS